MLHTVYRFSIFGAKIGSSVAARIPALHVFDIFVAQRLTMLLAMTGFLPSRPKIGHFDTTHCLTPFAFVIVMATLLTMPLAILWLATSRTMSWVLLAPGDLAAFVLDVDVALQRVLLAVHTFPTWFTEVRSLATAQFKTELWHLSALIIRQGVFPDILRGQPEEN